MGPKLAARPPKLACCTTCAGWASEDMSEKCGGAVRSAPAAAAPGGVGGGPAAPSNWSPKLVALNLWLPSGLRSSSRVAHPAASLQGARLGPCSAPASRCGPGVSQQVLQQPREPPERGTVSSPRHPALPCPGQASTSDKGQVTGTLMGPSRLWGAERLHPRHCRCPGLPARCQEGDRGTATEMRVLEGAQPRHPLRTAPPPCNINLARHDELPGAPIALHRV